MKTGSHINYPECGTHIDINDVLKNKIEDSIKKEYQDKSIKQSRALKNNNKKTS